MENKSIVKEMNQHEIQETNGGVAVILALGLIAAGGVVVKEICDIVKSE